MRTLEQFLSPGRFWRNIRTHFPVPMICCMVIAFSFLYAGFFWETHVSQGVFIALNFSTAASCFRRRFGAPPYVVWAAAALGLMIGLLAGPGTVTSWCMMVSLGICVLLSCWTRRFYLQVLLVPGWFVLCFALTFFLEFDVLGLQIFPLILIVPFTISPFLFLGGLPFGDESFKPAEEPTR